MQRPLSILRDEIWYLNINFLMLKLRVFTRCTLASSIRPYLIYVKVKLSPGILYENISIYVLKYGYQIQWYHAINLDHVRVKLHSRRNNHNHMQKYLSHEQ